MNYILFFFKSKLLTAAGLWSMFVGGIVMVISSIFDFVIPIWPFMAAVFFLTLLDMWTGVQAAKVRIKKFKLENPNIEPKEKINSRGYFRTSQKIGVYVCGILGAHAIYIVFFKGLVPFELPVESPLAYLVSFPMVRTELKSLDENVLTVTGTSFWANIKKYFK